MRSIQKFWLLLPSLFFFPLSFVVAQARLDKKISISLHQKPLAQALTEIGRKGGFLFSYNTTILPGDSLVDVQADGATIRQLLNRLLGENYEYPESGKYIIILQRPNAPPVKLYTITGYIRDEVTHSKIEKASVYETDQLVSTLTDTNGFFKLRLKDRHQHASLVVSKQFYHDTVLYLRAGYDQQVAVDIATEKVSDLTPFVVTNHVEKTWLGKFFLSTRSVVQSLNLMNFFARKPVQMSLTPGLGSHGKMSGQVVNKLSLNLVGGYSAGLNGVELAGVFNFDKKEVRYVQVAGISNVVGGKVSGVQLAGIHNHDLDSVSGVQAAGISNKVSGDFSGVQLAGVINIAQKSTKGVQVSVINYTKKLKGVQIGLVNIADSSSGLMIGLVNIAKNGMHTFSVSSNELLPFNISYKTGSRKLYSILQAGFDPFNNEKAYGYGLGIGKEINFSSRFSLNMEALVYNLLVAHGRNLPLVERLQMVLNVRLRKGVALFAGPAISLANESKSLAPDGYKMVLPRAGYHTFAVGNCVSWIGWSAGINIF